MISWFWGHYPDFEFNLPNFSLTLHCYVANFVVSQITHIVGYTFSGQNYACDINNVRVEWTKLEKFRLE